MNPDLQEAHLAPLPNEVENVNEGQVQAAAKQLDLTTIENTVQSLLLEWRLQGLSAQVKPFSGENAKNLRTWLRDMSQIGITLHNDNEKLKVLAVQTLKGSASDFVSRTLGANPAISWGT